MSHFFRLGLVLLSLSFSLPGFTQVRSPAPGNVSRQAIPVVNSPAAKKLMQAPAAPASKSSTAVTPAKSKVSPKSKSSKKISTPSLHEQLMTHWHPLKGDAVLNALAKVSVGTWVPAPRGMYPLQFINEEIETFEKQNGKITSKTQAKELEKKLQPYLAKIRELPAKQVQKWLKTCRYEAVTEDLLPTEVRVSPAYQKLNLKDAYIFEDEMGAFINVLALRDGKVWLRTYASLEEQANQTEAKQAEKTEEMKTFTTTMPLVDFSYVLRKSFESKQCIGGKTGK